jgi:hypothetical protein
MKTSDKLLLTLAFLILATFGVINLTLYARMKAGHIKNMFSHEGWARVYTGSAHSKIILRGNINVTIVPSDSCTVEAQEEAAWKVHCEVTGDSMIVSSSDTLPLNSHTFWGNYGDRPWVSIDMPSTVNLIRTEGQLALFRGGLKPGHQRFDIQAVNSQVWLGETYGIEGSYYPNYYYDSVHVQAVNSNLVIHPNAEISQLFIRLDNQSEINDFKGTHGMLYLQYAPESKLNIKGSTLDKLVMLKSDLPGK